MIFRSPAAPDPAWSSESILPQKKKEKEKKKKKKKKKPGGRPRLQALRRQ